MACCRPLFFSSLLMAMASVMLCFQACTVSAINSSTVARSTPILLPEPTQVLQVQSTTIQTSTPHLAMTTSLIASPTPEPVFEKNITTYGDNICEPYISGGQCQPVLGAFPTVITNLSRSDQLHASSANERILQTLETFTTTDECLSLAIPLLCRYSFPTCDPAFRIPTYQPVCRRDCQAAQYFVCKEPWLQMEALIEVLNLDVIDQPDCDPLLNPNGGDTPMCVSTVDVFQGEIPLSLQSGPTCYSGHGRGYTGTVNVTRDGIPCQRWDLNYPHQHLLSYEQHPELQGGHNYCRNPGERGERPWCFTTNRTKRWDYCDIPECPGPACENYQGDICFDKGLIGHDKVFIDKNRLNGTSTQADFEEGVKRLRSTWERYEPECAEIFLELLCATNFPSCDLTKDVATPIRPCRSFCERAHEACGAEIGNIEKFKLIIGYDPVEIVFDCSILPDTKAGGLPECFTPVTRLQEHNTDIMRCYTPEDKGSSYQGTVNTTISGKTCQEWSAQTPHQHTITPVARVYLRKHNYCRNPEQRGDRPWCYTTDPNTRWEYCNVPSCDGAPIDPTVTDAPLPQTTVIIISIVVPVAVMLAILFVLLLICVTWCCTQRNHTPTFVMGKETDSHHYVQNAQMAAEKGGDFGLGPLYCKNPLSTETPIEYDGAALPEIPRESMVYTRDLGQGHFGVVVQAEASCVGPEQKPRTVAVKVLKVGASVQVKKEFFREAALMNSIDHPNILKLFGVCIEQEPLCMVFECMEKGDLNNFLRQNTPKPPCPGLPIPQLVQFCIEIAAGLEYLAQNHYVHRDLATRNCLVSSTYQVKISDFGLSQDIYSSDYFTLGDAELLPIRWMPPEAILYSKFTIQSDVWSYGVVLWEIFSFGIQPYYTMSNEEVVQHVRDGNVMSCPDDCPTELYDLMIDCWAMNPSDRPTATELHLGLKRWSPNLSAMIQVEQSGTYQNMGVVREYAQNGATSGQKGQLEVVNGTTGDAYDHLHALHEKETVPDQADESQL